MLGGAVEVLGLLTANEKASTSPLSSRVLPDPSIYPGSPSASIRCVTCVSLACAMQMYVWPTQFLLPPPSLKCLPTPHPQHRKWVSRSRSVLHLLLPPPVITGGSVSSTFFSPSALQPCQSRLPPLLTWTSRHLLPLLPAATMAPAGDSPAARISIISLPTKESSCDFPLNPITLRPGPSSPPEISSSKPPASPPAMASLTPLLFSRHSTWDALVPRSHQTATPLGLCSLDRNRLLREASKDHLG